MSKYQRAGASPELRRVEKKPKRVDTTSGPTRWLDNCRNFLRVLGDIDPKVKAAAADVGEDPGLISRLYHSLALDMGWGAQGCVNCLAV